MLEKNVYLLLEIFICIVKFNVNIYFYNWYKKILVFDIIVSFIVIFIIVRFVIGIVVCEIIFF